MKAYLDESELKLGPPAGATGGAGAAGLGFAHALEEARRAAQALGRVIVEVKLDGRAMSDDELEAGQRGVKVDPPPGKVEFVSVDPRELVATSLEQAADALEEARDVQAAAAELLASGDVNGALAPISEVVGVWEAVRAVLDQGPQLIGRPLTGLLAAEAKVGEHTLALSACLQGFKHALEGQDWSTLGDHMASEMDQQARVWSGLLRDMARRVTPG
jgi:hypothetical protein